MPVQELIAPPPGGWTSPRERISQTLARRYTSSRVQIDGPVSVRDNSQVFHVLVGTGPGLELAVKCCLLPHTSSPDARSTGEQYAALGRVHRAFAGGRGIRVPEPVFVDEAIGIFAMSWIDGRSLTRLMHQPAVMARGANAFEAVGAWLGTFHSLGPVREGLYAFNERLAAINEFASSPLPDARFASAIQLLIRMAPGLERCRLWLSWLHGDCKPDNFLLRGTEVFGIDISLRHENAVEHDLAQFLNNLELAFADPRCLHLFAMRSALTEAFWRGYGRAGPRVCEVFLCWLRLYAALSLWRSTVPPRRGGGVRAWFLNQGFSRLVSRLTQRLASETPGFQRDPIGRNSRDMS